MVLRSLAVYDEQEIDTTLLNRIGQRGIHDPSPEESALTQEDEESLLERLRIRLADQKRQIAAQAERIRVLESLAVTDELTGLLNRRGFRENMDRILAAASRHADKGILVLCDLDNFKLINDTHGHIAGDIILRHVGHALEQHTRRNDCVCRIGGDEFAILMPRTPPVFAHSLTEKLENLINRQKLEWNGTSISIRASFGYETFDGTTDVTSLFAKADQLLYERKRRPTESTLSHTLV
ncbi:GGDEF domain-containing protein [Fodinicurvata fenggangensis]|uniref:GGDEF domain-containing protein n=1 Tax=Fodinicurvata fenggangensis TaxID=1121830 RepID=UPI00068C18C1|nr:GGDEF domain-containing protein [Fodinicurvata fenggangensis]